MKETWKNWPEAGSTIFSIPPWKKSTSTDFLTTVSVGEIGDRLCGPVRPGHFDVATVAVLRIPVARPFPPGAAHPLERRMAVVARY